MANFFDRAGMSTTTSGTGTITLGSALGATAPNTCSYESFAAAGAIDQSVISYLILDSNGAWEVGYGTYTASGTTLTRTVTRSSNSNALISLTGSGVQVYITARAEDIASIEAHRENNLIINAACDISQINGTNAVSLANNVNYYALDQWLTNKTSSGALTVTVQQANFNLQATPAGFTNVLTYTAGTGQATLGANDWMLIWQQIEGWRVNRLGCGVANAKPITVGFWVYAPIVGNMNLVVANNSWQRVWAQPFPVVVGWNWFTTIVPPETTGGTVWQQGTNVGMHVGVCVGAGSAMQATPNIWSTAGFLIGTPTTTNFMASNSNQVAITGMIVLPGAHVLTPEMSSAMMRSFDVELALCQRYWEKSYDYATLPAAATLNGAAQYYLYPLPVAAYSTNIQVGYKVRKRALPTVTSYSPVTGASGKARDYSNTVDVNTSVGNPGETACALVVTSSAGSAQLNIATQWVADARM